MDLFKLLKQDHRNVRQIFKKLGQTSDRAIRTRERLFAQLKQELELHAHVEETHFYPQLRNKRETKELVQEALQEHNEVKQALAALDGAEKGDERWTQQLTELEQNVEHHVEEEETELFPLVEKVLDKSQLEEIAAAIQGEKEAAE